ncbi:hypothetical protein ACFOTA_02980 [Chitinophaga sp. GCM10012297]|uniref:Uncharacterized protein n=1 Tax=Chitinophaga chungangae TaxID=2821488 RepID=A0ABS3Y904_9BACT|nr:hypothetical protein [Chitinophaga chungangae]MBO9151155.1 hypothetical protein [Chitinophaga chungangae]
MNAKFLISQNAVDQARPPISHQVAKYLEHFITERVLKEKRIILDGQWNVRLSMFFIEDGPRFQLNGVLFQQTATARTVKAERLKIFQVFVSYTAILKSEDPYRKTITLMYEAIKAFFTSIYKKVSPDFMDELFEELDFAYLMSLPYPAPFEDQKYVGDSIVPGEGNRL